MPSSTALAAGLFVAARPLPIRIVGRMRRVQGKRVQNIGEQQFLMLLLVLQPDLDDRPELVEILRGRDQFRHRVIDMRAIGRDLRNTRPRDQAALRPRLPRTGGDIIRIVEKGEALVENAIGLGMRPQQELFEEPGHMRAMPFGRARVGHRLNDLVLGRQQRRAAFGLGAHRAKGLEPVVARVSVRTVPPAAGGCPNSATASPATAECAVSAGRTRVEAAECGMIKVREGRN